MSTLHYTNDDQSNGCKDSIHAGNEGLGLENNSESTSNFFSYNGPFIIKKPKIPISDATEKVPNTDAIDNKNIGEY